MKVFVWSEHYPDYDERMEEMTRHAEVCMWHMETSAYWHLVPKV